MIENKMNEVIKIPYPNDDVLGYLKTQDGLVILRKSIPETFEIAYKMLGLLKANLEKNKK